MTTALDLGLFEYFGVIFPFLFAVILVYAILEYTKIIGNNKAINSMIGLIAGMMLIMSDNALLLIKFITPWFVLLFIFLFLMLTIYAMFGAKEKDFQAALLGEDKTVLYWIIALSVLILVLGLGTVYGETLSPYTGGADTTTDNFEANAWSAFFHPKVVGLIFLSLVAVFTIKLLAGDVRR